MRKSTRKKILFAASECTPFVKTGGLADVVGSLPQHLDSSRYDVRVIMPKYLCIPQEYVQRMTYLTNFRIDLGWRNQYVGLFEMKLGSITFYFIDNEFYFCGFQPYGQIFQDIEKFAFYSKAVIESCGYLDFMPDIIHCHDWQAALIPVFLDQMCQQGRPEGKIKTILTIHNLRFQGRWGLDEVQDITGLADRYLTGEYLEAYGDANYLKGGIVLADRVTTVSPTYSREIKTPFYGEGLHTVIENNAGKVSGILNGLDLEEFNPMSDPMIPHHYSVDTFRRQKPADKAALQKKLGLEVDKGKMVFGIVSRLTDQKGFDLIGSVLPEFLKGEVQLAVIGSGESRYEGMFDYYARTYPGKVAFYRGYSEETARLIYAGSDAFLMPSIFEPCGLSQLIAMRYGSIPVVRETGGLKDTVEPYNEYEDTGCGFSFAGMRADELLKILYYAEDVYYRHKRRWNHIVDRAMTMDYSWEASAKCYGDMYDELTLKGDD